MKEKQVLEYINTAVTAREYYTLERIKQSQILDKKYPKDVKKYLEENGYSSVEEYDVVQEIKRHLNRWIALDNQIFNQIYYDEEKNTELLGQQFLEGNRIVPLLKKLSTWNMFTETEKKILDILQED